MAFIKKLQLNQSWEQIEISCKHVVFDRDETMFALRHRIFHFIQILFGLHNPKHIPESREYGLVNQ